MKTNLDFPAADLIAPVAFRDDFNNSTTSLTATQSWSLFFTGGKADNALGFEPELGRFFTFALIGIAAASIMSSIFLVGTV
jgi:hypothetical protein